MNHRIKWLGSLGSAALMLALVSSCADGFDSKEVFSAGVSNAQLEAPVLNELETQVNSDGSESVIVSWPVIMGAGGYLANVVDVTVPASPVYVVKDSVIDGCKFTFPREDDTKYEISVSTLGNEKLNNKASLAATEMDYSTMIPATIIPNGTELSSYFAQNFVPGSQEVAFELEPNGNYTITGSIDFGLNPITFRGNKVNRPLVVFSEQATIQTQAGLKIRNINFDMSAAQARSFITLSENPDASISTEALGLKTGVNPKDCYVIKGQVAIESCNFRNLPGAILWTNEKDYNLVAFRIQNCVVQMKNSSSKSFIDFGNNSGTASAQTLLLKNSTFYNIEENNSAYFIRYANASNAVPHRVFGVGAQSTHTLDHCTLDKTFTGKNFCDRIVNNKEFELDVFYSIFVDVMQFNKYKNASAIYQAKYNVGYGKVSSSDLAYMDEVDPDFAGPIDQMFNLDLPLGGVSFRPQNSYCVEHKIGDPRWYE